MISLITFKSYENCIITLNIDIPSQFVGILIKNVKVWSEFSFYQFPNFFFQRNKTTKLLNGDNYLHIKHPLQIAHSISSANATKQIFKQ